MKETARPTERKPPRPRALVIGAALIGILIITIGFLSWVGTNLLSEGDMRCLFTLICGVVSMIITIRAEAMFIDTLRRFRRALGRRSRR